MCYWQTPANAVFARNWSREGPERVVGSLRPTFPYKFSGVYMIVYGIVSTFSNIDPDKVYDYHTAFDIKPTEVVYNVDINANQKEI